MRLLPALSLLAACGPADPTDAPPEVDFAYRPGVEIVTVTEAEPGQHVTLVDPDGVDVVTMIADEEGQAHFAYLPDEHAVIDARDAALFAALRAQIRDAQARSPGMARHLDGVDPDAVTDRAGLARLPVLRKSALVEMQKAAPPLGGLTTRPAGEFDYLFQSPGPIYEPGMSTSRDWWRFGRAFHAAGFRKGDLIHKHIEVHGVFGGKRDRDNKEDIQTTLHLAGEQPTPVEVPETQGDHGGADPIMLGYLFNPEGMEDDAYDRSSNHIGGGWSILTGIAANTSIETGAAVNIQRLLDSKGVKLE